MAYVIAEPCVATCDTACVSVCPVDCIRGPIPVDEIARIPAALRGASSRGSSSTSIPRFAFAAALASPCARWTRSSRRRIFQSLSATTGR